MEDDPVFRVGDRVRKISGDYELVGEVASVFRKRSGQWRFVVEADHPPGLLMIYKAENLMMEK